MLFGSSRFWEALKLLVRDGTYLRRLTALVRPKQTVEPVAFELQRAVGQREGALVQVHTLRVLLIELLRWLRFDGGHEPEDVA